jgi:peroxin-7
VKTNKLLPRQQTTFIVTMEFRTEGYNGYAIKYSPFVNDRLAVATAANFGLVGNGRLYILGLTGNGIVLQKQ